MKLFISSVKLSNTTITVKDTNNTIFQEGFFCLTRPKCTLVYLRSWYVRRKNFDIAYTNNMKKNWSELMNWFILVPKLCETRSKFN